MNKQRILKQKATKTAIKGAAVVAVMTGVYFGVTMFAEGSAKNKTDAESQANRSQTLLSDLKSQVDKSGEAEKRFAEIQTARGLEVLSTADIGTYYDGSFERFRKTLTDTISRHRLADSKLSGSLKEEKTTRPELANFDYEIFLRPKLKIEFSAISDVHVFSFIDDLKRNAPGLIRIDSVTMERLSDLSDATMVALQSGETPLAVKAAVEFTLFTLDEKKTEPAEGSAKSPGQ
jgi:hypothetical protein